MTIDTALLSLYWLLMVLNFYAYRRRYFTLEQVSSGLLSAISLVLALPCTEGRWLSMSLWLFSSLIWTLDAWVAIPKRRALWEEAMRRSAGSGGGSSCTVVCSECRGPVHYQKDQGWVHDQDSSKLCPEARAVAGEPR
jgi:hypothetical protein